jgi:hypothetical protein
MVLEFLGERIGQPSEARRAFTPLTFSSWKVAHAFPAAQLWKKLELPQVPAMVDHLAQVQGDLFGTAA